MIDWMQTHRKWLIITIWIATIAFVGAGFMGWGQFRLGKKQSIVAEVKNTEVTIKDWQNAYTQIFNRVNKQMGGTLDDATAKKLGLKKLALQKAVQDAILRQYAKDLGLYVTDKEMAKKIIDVFGSDKIYKRYLRNARMEASDFEKSLRKQLLIEKLFSFLNIKPAKAELLSTASALYDSDNVDIQIIKRSNLSINLNEEEIKQYWQKNKNHFLSNKQYKIVFVKIPLKTNASDEKLKDFYNENKLNYKNVKGEIIPFKKALDKVKIDYAAQHLKKEAVFAYKKLKTNNGNYNITTVNEHNSLIPQDKMKTLKQNGYLKPFIYNDAYIIAKLIEEIKPKPLTFEKAKAYVTEELMNRKTNNKLVEISKKEYKTFKGQNIGFVTKFDMNKIKNLSVEYATQFLQKVFVSQNPNYFILIPQNNPKISILYRIKEQKLLDNKEYTKNKKIIYNISKNILQIELFNNLLQSLQEKYRIKVYVK